MGDVIYVEQWLGRKRPLYKKICEAEKYWPDLSKAEQYTLINAACVFKAPDAAAKEILQAMAALSMIVKRRV